MKFGKLTNIETIDFTLPKNHPLTANTLASLPKGEEKPNVFVGCTGWSMKEWLGEVYVKGTKPKDFLAQYVRQFNTIELNTTHYRIPDAKTIEQWKQTAIADFRYCPKIPQTISHSRDLGFSTEYLSLFCAAISRLNEHLGCAFMQLPPYFDHEKLAILAHFLQRFPTEIPLAVEVRHESWFNTPSYFNDLMALLKTHNVTPVITDVAGRRDVLHQCLTNQRAMIRFVGNGLHSTDYERIDDWVSRLTQWFDFGLKEVYFFPHQPDNILAPQMVAYFVEKMQHAYDVNVRGPKLNMEQAGAQFSLF